jgi:Flp pilus assembly protein TadD
VAEALHAALVRAGQGVEADRLVADWLGQHPQDATFQFRLGEAAVERRDWAGAEARLRQVLSLQPRHAAAMNNLAWLMVQQGKARAAALAQQAAALMPDRPAGLDTWSMALEAERNVLRALEVQKRATEIDPRNPDCRLRLAALLLKSGERSAARDELKRLSMLGARYPRQAEVAAMLTGL